MTWINWMKFRQERFEGINYHPLDKMALHVWLQKSILKRGTFAVQLLPCDVAQPIRAQQSTLIMSDHAQLYWKNKNNSNNYTTTRTTRTTTQKQKVIITLSNKLMVVIIQTTQIMPLVRKHHHDVVASLASFDSPVGLAWDHLNL